MLVPKCFLDEGLSEFRLSASPIMSCSTPFARSGPTCVPRTAHVGITPVSSLTRSTTRPPRAGERKRARQQHEAAARVSIRAGSLLRNVFLKIRLDTNRRKIHAARLRGAVAAPRLIQKLRRTQSPETAKPASGGRTVRVNRGDFGSVQDQICPKSAP